VGVKVSFLLERGTPPRMNPILAEACARLEARGIQVALRFPEHELTRVDMLRVDSDLYVLKSNTSLAFTLATVLDRLGGPLLNCYEACLATRDKVLAAATLAAASIPAPRSLVAGQPGQFAARLAAGPLIVKPYRGAYGRGVTVADRPAALPAADEHPEFAFAQDYLHPARTDLKVFGIGDEVFGVRKTFGADSFLHTGEPAALSPEVESIVRRVAEAFGLELFGVDVAEDERGAYVFDVNSFPGFRGVPDAARRLAAYIERRARDHA
jgi:ribosomal protein S6--L-glutamate ligase